MSERSLASYRLTPEQKRILLTLCDASEKNRTATLTVTTGPNPIRETTTAAALVRKGLAEKVCDTIYRATIEGYWLGDALRVEWRLGKVPPRRL